MLIKDRTTPFGGKQQIHRFENGYGASVACDAYTYGGPEGLKELAVLEFSGPEDDEWSLCYDTEITDDVIGYLPDEDVERILKMIEAL